MATYSVYISDQFGNRLAAVSRFSSLKYSRIVNDVGTLTLELPSDFDTTLLRIPDGRVEVWRNVNGREYLDTETVWLIQKVTYKRNAAGLERIIVEADTPIGLMRHRIVNKFAGVVGESIYAAAPADTQILTLFGQEVVDFWLPGYIAQSISPALGASVTKAIAWRDLLKVMQEFAEASTAAGTYVAFDIVAPTPDTLQMRTYVGQRGIDRRYPSGVNPLLLSPDFGNIGESQLVIDWRDFATEIVCGGGGQGLNRAIGTARDLTLIGATPFGERYKFIEYTSSTSTSVLNDEADAELRASRPRLTYTGKILDTPSTLYGRDWAWGDYVTVQDFGRLIDCRIDAITVTVQPSDNYETIEAWLRSEDYLV